jgi:hypothetical protein
MINYYFFERGRASKGPETALNISGRLTSYIKDLPKERNNNKVPTSFEEAPTKN